MKDLHHTLIINGDERKSFANQDAFLFFLDKEMNNWQWLLEASPKNIATLVYELFIAGRITEVLKEIRITEMTIQDLGTQEDPFILDESPEGRLIQKTRNKWGINVALLVYLQLTKENRKKCLENNDLSNFLIETGASFEQGVAINIITLYEGTLDLVGVTPHAPSNIREIENQIQRLQMVIEDKSELNEDRYKSIKKSSERMAHGMRERLRRREVVWNKYARKIAKNISTQLGASESDLKDSRENFETAKAKMKAAEETYHSKLDLEAAVTYWKSRSRIHNLFKFVWLCGVIGSMFITLAAMGIYFAVGGATGISPEVREFTYKKLNDYGVFSLPPTDKVKDKPKTVAAKAIPEDKLGKQEIANFGTNIAGAALLLTLLAVIVRLSLRQFNMHSHFSIECTERVIFTKTFLALMRDGHLNVDNDRRLVLEALFRQNQFSNTNELSFSPPVEQALKSAIDNLKGAKA